MSAAPRRPERPLPVGRPRPAPSWRPCLRTTCGSSCSSTRPAAPSASRPRRDTGRREYRGGLGGRGGGALRVREALTGGAPLFPGASPSRRPLRPAPCPGSRGASPPPPPYGRKTLTPPWRRSPHPSLPPRTTKHQSRRVFQRCPADGASGPARRSPGLGRRREAPRPPARGA